MREESPSSMPQDGLEIRECWIQECEHIIGVAVMVYNEHRTDKQRDLKKTTVTFFWRTCIWKKKSLSLSLNDFF